jgi:hypothetical protein
LISADPPAPHGTRRPRLRNVYRWIEESHAPLAPLSSSFYFAVRRWNFRKFGWNSISGGIRSRTRVAFSEPSASPIQGKRRPAKCEMSALATQLPHLGESLIEHCFENSSNSNYVGCLYTFLQILTPIRPPTHSPSLSLWNLQTSSPIFIDEIYRTLFDVL